LKKGHAAQSGKINNGGETMNPDLKTKIVALGLDEKEIAMLTPAAKELTLGDLVQLRDFALKPAEKGKPEDKVLADFDAAMGMKLSMQDVRSFQDAFEAQSARRDLTLLGADCCCCTCTPCCSCTA
jgi:hypothetical protein